MFLDLQNIGPMPEPWEPPTPPRMSRKRERVIRWLIAFNLVMLLVGPLAGASLLELLVPVVRH